MFETDIAVGDIVIFTGHDWRTCSMWPNTEWVQLRHRDTLKVIEVNDKWLTLETKTYGSQYSTDFFVKTLKLGLSKALFRKGTPADIIRHRLKYAPLEKLARLFTTRYTTALSYSTNSSSTIMPYFTSSATSTYNLYTFSGVSNGFPKRERKPQESAQRRPSEIERT